MSPILISELQMILKEDYNIDLPMDIVLEIGESFVSYFDLIGQMAKHEKGSDGQ